MADLGCLFGDGVLLAGDAGRFNTTDGVGSWTVMASGMTAAHAVKHACEQGDFSRVTLAIYRDLLDEQGLVKVNAEAQEDWQFEQRIAEQILRHPDRLLHLAERYLDDGYLNEEEHHHSLLGDAYHRLVKPGIPWYIRWPVNVAFWVDTLNWRRVQSKNRTGRRPAAQKVSKRSRSPTQVGQETMDSRQDEKLAALASEPDPEPHIVVQVERCPTCDGGLECGRAA